MSDVTPQSSAAPAVPLPSVDLAALSFKERLSWRQTGKMPEAPAPPAEPGRTAESSPATPAAPAPSTDGTSKAASEPAAPATPAPKKAESSGAEKRIKELLAENARLKQQRASDDTRSAPAPTESKPAVETKPDLAVLVSSPDIQKPLLSDGEFWEQYPQATLADFNRYVAQHTWRSNEARQQQESSFRATTDQFAERLSAGLTADPDAKAAIHPDFWTMVPYSHLSPADRAKATSVNVIADHLLTAEAPVSLMRHLSTHPDEFAAIAALRDPMAIARAMGRLDARLERDASSTSDPSPVSSAPPPPPTTLGNKPQLSTLSDVDRAVRDGDFGAYKRSMNKRR